MLFGHKRKLHSFSKRVAKYQKKISELPTAQLRERFQVIKNETIAYQRLTLDKTAEVFAIVSLVSGQVLSKQHYPSQLMGGLVLAELGVAEMMTGEGKTLVAALPAAIGAVRGMKVHIATTNDYLASRDAEELRPLYEALGMTVGVVSTNMRRHERQDAYSCDVVYSTVSELGFDYLRDKLVSSPDERVQQGHDFILVDEADSLLIDMGVMPLIMSGQSKKDPSIYEKLYPIVLDFTYVPESEAEMANNADVSINVKTESVAILEPGYEKLEKIFLQLGLVNDESELYRDKGVSLIKAAEQCMKAFKFQEKDRDYLVQDGKVYLVDKNTGRVSYSRRWNNGLHQAVEAKEKVEVKPESETVASIAIQNYVGLYREFSGMTGTALTAKKEFRELYHVEVVNIPTNKPIARDDDDDIIFETANDKWLAIVKRIVQSNKRGQPILVGTSSVKASDHLSSLLKKEGIKHSLLSAKHHEQEAMIIAQAGRPYAVTIATNMAGRGTDIILGGNAAKLVESLEFDDDEHAAAIRDRCLKDREFVLKAGGLLVIGTERQESRRIDDQLRGRAGRQGDPGESVFFVSVEDAVIQRFSADYMMSVLKKLGLSGMGEGFKSLAISKGLSNIQQKIEDMDSNARKNTMRYDSVNQMIRNGFYDIREQWVDISDDELFELLPAVAEQAATLVADGVLNEFNEEDRSVSRSAEAKILYLWQLDVDYQALIKSAQDEYRPVMISETIATLLSERISDHINKIGYEVGIGLARRACLDLLDEHWSYVQSELQELQSGSFLKGFAQKNPIVEYRHEADALLRSAISDIELELPERILKEISEQLDFEERMTMDVIVEG